MIKMKLGILLIIVTGCRTTNPTVNARSSVDSSRFCGQAMCDCSVWGLGEVETNVSLLKPRGKIEGWTSGPHTSAVVVSSCDVLDSGNNHILMHECAHICQMARWGLIRYGVRYFLESRKGYLGNKFEIEAYTHPAPYRMIH